jgi:hypothetical protein
MANPFTGPARLQESTEDAARCLTCERRCLIAEGKRGWCGSGKKYKYCHLRDDQQMVRG